MIFHSLSSAAFVLLALVLLSTPASAELANERGKFVVRAVKCNVVTGVLAALKGLGKPATSFCSSYLHVPAGRTTTTTVQSTVTVTDTAVTTFTSTYSSCNAPMARKRNEGRDAMPEPTAYLAKKTVPKALTKYAAAEISSACKCLNIHPVTITVTQTADPSTTHVQTTTTFTTCCRPNGAPCDFGNGPQGFAGCCGGGCEGVGGDTTGTCVVQ